MSSIDDEPEPDDWVEIGPGAFMTGSPVFVEIGSARWDEIATDILGYPDGVVILRDPRCDRGVAICGADIAPKRPIWSEICRILGAAGISVPLLGAGGWL